MTEMASNQLIKDWIQYLKNNQITALKSDPTSGKLNYRRSPTADDLVNFLQIKTDYDDETINNAINSVVSKKSSGQLAQQVNQPQQSQQQPPQADNPPTQKKYNTDDATDVEPRYGPRPALSGPRTALPAPSAPEPAPQPTQPGTPERKRTGGKIKGEISQTPNAIRKRAARSRRGNINEEFEDDPGEDLSEKDVQAIFDILSQTQPSQDSQTQGSTQNKGRPQPARVDPQQVRVEEVNKLKRVIRDTMTDQQRLSLWRALHE